MNATAQEQETEIDTVQDRRDELIADIKAGLAQARQEAQEAQGAAREASAAAETSRIAAANAATASETSKKAAGRAADSAEIATNAADSTTVMTTSVGTRLATIKAAFEELTTL